MDKAGAIQTYVDKGGLHARQHPHHLALVDIAYVALAIAALDVKLLQNPVFHQRDAGLHRRDVNQDFFAHASAPSGCHQGTLKLSSSTRVVSRGSPTTLE